MYKLQVGMGSMKAKQQYRAIVFKSEWDSTFIAEDIFESREGASDMSLKQSMNCREILMWLFTDLQRADISK